MYVQIIISVRRDLIVA